MKVKMKKALICGLKSEKDEIMREMQECGIFHFVALEKAPPVESLYAELGKIDVVLQHLSITSETCEKTSKTIDEIYDIILNNQQNAAEIEKLSAIKAKLSPWVDYDVDVARQETKMCRIIRGYINKTPYFDVMPKSEEFTPPPDFVAEQFEGLTGKPSAIIQRLEAQIEGLKPADLSDYNKYYASIAAARARVADEIKRAETFGTFRQTGAMFLAECWAPAHQISALDRMNVQWQIIETDEPAPVVLRNNKFVEPFEVITELFALPNPRERDPSVGVAVFYFLFFGIMLADAGYGLLLTIVCPLILALKKPTGMGAKLLKMLALCGVSAIFFGIAFGSFFGNALPEIFGINFKPLIIDPMTQSMLFLIISFVFGIIHIVVALANKEIQLICEGKWLDALCDILPWQLILLSVPIAFISTRVALIVVIVSAIVILVTAGRNERNVFKKIIAGFGSLYGITSYFSDILSYSRFLALGLAGSVISIVVNTMAVLGGGGVIGTITLVLIFLVGHALNLGISVLGAYVHASRLQYVEYFSKFYTGGGEKYSPLTGDRGQSAADT